MATDTHRINGSAEALILFCPFRLLPKQRLLTRADKPISLGSRAFDVLIALLERPGELISKPELMARVWPNTFVGPANLAMHISALRRALGDGRDGNRYVVNIPGRGYRFVAAVTIVEDPPHLAVAPVGDAGAAMLQDYVAQLAHGCVLTLVGAGGRKMSLALALVADPMVMQQQDGVCRRKPEAVEEQ
jgi:DNA-binding winged helix-turn-helix (wHTH) protein